MILNIFLFTGWIIIKCYGFTCEEEFFSSTVYKECPGPLDDQHALFCCGPKIQRFCCSSLGEDIEHFQNLNRDIREIVKRSTELTEATVNPEVAVTQEGFRDDVNKIKTKVKEKVNDTITDAKDKVKQKVKDKIQKKIEEKLDSTAGHMKLPAIIGTIVGVIVLIIICYIFCCCCPFCILYKRRQRSCNQPVAGDVQVQPLTNIEREYTPVEADAQNP